MEITKIKLNQVEGNNRLKAFASVVLDDELVINNVKIIDGTSGLFIAMPSKRDKSGNHFDIAHPISQNMRNKLTIAVLDAYNNRLEDQSAVYGEVQSCNYHRNKENL